MKFKYYNQKQGIFKTIIPNDLLGADDPARIIDKIFSQLDLSRVYAYYKEVGNTAYHPLMMLKILFYSYYLGIHSCRKMWDSLKKRADFIYLSGDQLPDFRTINDFRIRHIDQIPDIFTQVVMLCERLDMIGFEHLAVDGQKIHANANFRKTYDKERLTERYQKVKTGIEKILKDNPELKKEESESEENEVARRKLEKLKLEETKLDELLKVFEEIEKSKDEESKAEEPKDEEPKDEESKDEESKDEESKDEESKDEESKDEESKTKKSKIKKAKIKKAKAKKAKAKKAKAKGVMLNLTDIEAKTMSHKDRTVKPSYNHQSAIDDKYGITVAVQTVSISDNDSHLLPIVDAAIKNVGGKKFSNVTADAGFCSYKILEQVELERLEVFYIPDQKHMNVKTGVFRGKYDNSRFIFDGGTMKCPADKEMNVTTDTEEKKVYSGVGCDTCPQKEKCTDGKTRTVTVVPEMKYRNIMREKLNTEEGRGMYSRRQGTVEPTHGDDQKNKGWKQHHLRGSFKAALEFSLIRIAANIGKMIKYKSLSQKGS
jgi:transposase